MIGDTYTVTDPDGIVVHVRRWLPEGTPRAAVHVLHGWGEHAGRYASLAGALTAAGLAVHADDHRGHGATGEGAGGLGDLGPGGPDGILQAVHAVTEAVRAAHPGTPLFLLGHSWGSFLAQRFVRHWGGALAGAVLTGTTDASLRREPGGDLNAGFAPARTAYDWLSRDPAEVDRYIADAWCGFEVMGGRPGGATGGERRLAKRSDDAIPSGLPVLILNGDADPIGGAPGAEALADRYRAAGLTDVSVRCYRGARHELFNETNRDEVTADLLAWLAARLA